MILAYKWDAEVQPAEPATGYFTYWRMNVR
jgi:hypothetical protein